jgi:hypothetical protein
LPFRPPLAAPAGDAASATIVNDANRALSVGPRAPEMAERKLPPFFEGA